MRGRLAVVLLAAAFFGANRGSAETNVECAVNLSKGSITNSQIAVQCGLTEQQVADILAGQEKLQATADETQATVDQTQATADETLALVKAFSAQTAELQRLKDAGVTEAALIELARRTSADIEDTAQAFTELKRLVEIAIAFQNEGRTPSNLGDFVDEVLRRAADLSAKGEFDEAAASIDAALAQEESDTKARTLRLLDAGIAQDMLRRDPESVAGRILRKIELEYPDSAKQFDQLRKIRREYKNRGRDRGLNLDLAVSIHLAHLELAVTGDLGVPVVALDAPVNDLNHPELVRKVEIGRAHV